MGFAAVPRMPVIPVIPGGYPHTYGTLTEISRPSTTPLRT